MGSDGYFHPNFGPEKGQDFTLNISTTSGVQARSEIEQLFQADMKAIGLKINIQNYTANTLFGTIGPKGEFQIIEFAWVNIAVHPRETSRSTARTPSSRDAATTGATIPTPRWTRCSTQALSTHKPGPGGSAGPPGGRIAVVGHGHAAAVPEPGPVRLVEQLRAYLSLTPATSALRGTPTPGAPREPGGGPPRGRGVDLPAAADAGRDRRLAGPQLRRVHPRRPVREPPGRAARDARGLAATIAAAAAPCI